ncbi:hypothetical protein GCM10020331_102560 [Ectobacillus funiculus]
MSMVLIPYVQRAARHLIWIQGKIKIQLYNYLGYNNQRWIITKKNDNGTVRITSVHNGKALEISGEGIFGT